MQYITQCPSYSSVITTPFRKDNYLLSQIVKERADLVGLDGFEPSTPALSRRCSNQLSYRPVNRIRVRRPRGVRS